MQGKKLLPNPEHATPEEIEIARESSPDKQQYIRLYAIQKLLEGNTYKEVARIFNRNENTLTTWVKKWNEGGVDAMRTIKPQGRPSKLSEDQLLQIKELLLSPSMAQECHWTIVKLHGYIRREWQLELGYTTLLDNVAKMGFRQVVPRTWSSKQDEEQRALFIENLKQLRSDNDNEIWFADESGFIADPRPRKRWVLIGSRPKIDYTGMHMRLSVVGAVEPASGRFESIIVPQVDREVFQVFLDHFAIATSHSMRKIHLVLDNATWHKAKCLNWHNITPVYLPVYSPDLNPIERLWAQIKSKFFADWIGKNHAQLWERLTVAILYFVDHEDEVERTCAL